MTAISFRVMGGCALSVLLMMGCGDDSGGDDKANAGHAGASGSAALPSAGRSGSSAPRTPLPADTAGKACASNADCGPGMCATQVQGLDGMPTMAPGGYCMGACATSADCGDGGVCVGALPMGMMGGASGQCYEGCMAATDCRDGYVCGPLTSTCRPAPPTDQLGDDVAGRMCSADGDCSGGHCLTMRGMMTVLPGGYCSGACLMDSHCGAGGVCRAALGGGAGSCYQGCASDADCTRDGYRCRDVGNGVMGCNPAPDPLPDNTTGKACTADTDCGGAMGACATELPVAMGGAAPAMGGYCSIACAIDADCGAGGACVNTRSGPRCFKPCTAATAATDCRPGYTCGERGGGDMPDLVCTPDVPDDGDAG